MSTPYTRLLTEHATHTPQSQPIPGREAEMEQNNAGGFTFTVDPVMRLRRFLILGTDGGTYYQSEPKLTADNVKAAADLIATDPMAVVDALEWAAHNAPRNEASLFVLAQLAAGGPDARAAAERAFPSVVRIGTHLYSFLGYFALLGGRWSRRTRRIVGSYFAMPADRLALHAVKYRQRNGWTYRDALRLAHPRSPSFAHRSVLQFMAGKPEWAAQATADASLLHDYAEASGTPSDGRLVELAVTLPWEAFRDEQRTPAVWKAMVPQMGLTALVRNLSIMARLGLLHDPAVLAVIESRFGAEPVARSRVHPLRFLDALLVHRAGGTVGRAYEHRDQSKPAATYTPSSRVIAALEAAVGFAFKAVEPTGRRLYIALDVSGSMSQGTCAGSVLLSPRDASAVLAMQHLREPNVELVGFSGGVSNTARYGSAVNSAVTQLDRSKFQSLAAATRYTASLPFAGTDCALPMIDAKNRGLAVDAFVVYTDNETWAGGVQPVEALRDYRRALGINARLIVVGMTATQFTIADPKDSGMLDVVGMSADTPAVITSFAKGW